MREIIKEKKYCKHCGCLNIKELSTGEIICQNKHCKRVSMPEIEAKVNKD